MKNRAKLLLCFLSSGVGLGVCCIIAFGFAPELKVTTRVTNGADSSDLFRDQPGARLLSPAIKELVIRNAAMAVKLRDTDQYEKAVACLLDGEEPIQTELNRLAELARSGNAADREETRSARALLTLYWNEDLAHAGECFLRAGLYEEAQTQFEKCIPCFRKHSFSGQWDHPTTHEAYKNYMATLEKLKETDQLTEVRNEYKEIVRATATAK